MLSPGLLEGTCVFWGAGAGAGGSLSCGFLAMVGLGRRLGWMSWEGFPNLSVVPFHGSGTCWEQEEAAPLAQELLQGGRGSSAPISGWAHSPQGFVSQGE